MLFDLPKTYCTRWEMRERERSVSLYFNIQLTSYSFKSWSVDSPRYTIKHWMTTSLVMLMLGRLGAWNDKNKHSSSSIQVKIIHWPQTGQKMQFLTLSGLYYCLTNSYQASLMCCPSDQSTETLPVITEVSREPAGTPGGHWSHQRKSA